MNHEQALCIIAMTAAFERPETLAQAMGTIEFMGSQARKALRNDTQRPLLTGLNCLPGQQDLINADGSK